MPFWLHAVVAVAGYLVGSLPTGYLVAKARGVDIRSVGSGNIGATNAMRVLGTVLGSVVLVVDALKGALACVLLPRLAALLAPSVAGGASEGWAVTAGISAIVGHNYTCWLGFRGGKGIATSAGVLLVLMPQALGLILAVWVVVFGVSRIVSLASISAALSLPLMIWGLGYPPVILLVGVLLSALAVYRHRQNLQRLWAGTEPRVGRRARRGAGVDPKPGPDNSAPSP